MSLTVVLPDGNALDFQGEKTVKEVAFEIGPGLGNAALAGRVDGELKELDTPLTGRVNLEIITPGSPEGLEIYRHTASHIMAHAVKSIYPDVQLGIGPAIEDGFYYDFHLSQVLSPDDLEAIQERMQEIIDADLPLKKKIVSKREAEEILIKQGEEYKLELLKDMEDGTITFYQQDDFLDLCRGPHLPSTGLVKAFKLLNVAGAYWRGDEKRVMLQRIYGTAFLHSRDLEEHLRLREEAEKRDHRRLGQQLDLFSLHPEAPGFPFLHPKGMVIWNQLIRFWQEEHRRWGYEEIKTPLILNLELWKQSGHWDHYRDNMYFTSIDEEDFAIKPMNCPGGILIYKSRKRSYRELPMRTAELGLVHRHERSGTLHGLMRVRAITQDDAHIFMLPSQIQDEIQGVIRLVDNFYQVFGFDYEVELSTRPENAMGDIEVWEQATISLERALDAEELSFTINEGDGAFYGPKIDFHLMDSLGRRWQCATIQLDFLMPERFDLTYVGSDGQEHRPVMIHRVVFGALERFLGVLIEHFAGAFPLWLSPVQVLIIPVLPKHMEYASYVQRVLSTAGMRVVVDDREEKVGYRIRQAQIQQVPYMLILGDKEQENNNLSLRDRREGDVGIITLEEFQEQLQEEIQEKRL